MAYIEFTRCAIYLRKSRADVELDASTGGDTLERHRNALFELAKKHGLTVSKVYQEVVTGDTIEGRPQMQLLLSDVEDGKWDAVLCMDIDRLGRGGMRDQGRILDAFKWSNTAIITPDKIYRLADELDEEQIEFKAQMARFEYRQIKKRMARGRAASASEGKFIGHTPPYGYDREKLEKQKGWKLVPNPEQAPIVKQIFRWYIGAEGDRLGVSLIARKLNDLGIPSPGGKDWTNCSIRTILSNPEYYGVIRSGNRPAKKSIDDGSVYVSRPRASAEEVRLYPGLHEPIISEEEYNRAQAILSNNPSRPGPKQVETKNPLSGLVICDCCGRAMVRRPYSGDRPTTLLCPYTSCHTVSSYLDDIEKMVLDSLRTWLVDFQLGDHAELPAADYSIYETQIQAIEKNITQLHAQRNRTYELVEQGVYSVDVFTERMQAIQRDLTASGNQLEAVRDELALAKRSQQRKAELLPTVAHVLDVYAAATPAERNDLLRSCISKISYHKTRRDRWQGGSDLELTVYPLF